MSQGIARIATGDVACADDADTEWIHRWKGYAIRGLQGAAVRVARARAR
jgi:hypothetical protein